MAYLYGRLICVFLSVLGALCLYFSMDYETPFKVTPVFSKRANGAFLQLPDTACERNAPFLVLLVTSAPQQAAARSAIRSTWGRERTVRGKRVRALFLLGATPSRDLARAVAREGQQHRDTVQKDFLDTYDNLTLKTMMGMEWVHRYCPQAAFAMKTDSDMFINVDYLVELLLKRNQTSRFFTGFLKMNEFPIRKKYNKWFVSKYEYPWDKYPPFCSGTGYVFSGDVASLVCGVAASVPFIRLEDVFVGLCLAELHIRPVPLHSEQTFFPEGLAFSTCRFRKVVACHFVKPQEMQMYWRALETSLGEECPGD
ncbi:PREDICTED: beta-1,3-galactosyltransferase 5-like [Condylura cristata]|uniref:beta-1,3-galactosyltransferase 5-like n=1 Tax=Condylura cristata TaxID=143302 RepID=UPI0003347F9C|nr:PREDICTED: beta-1,3-galactosyltransferase 5-like [Condylura cristata]XP_012584846.1 PREDICTED: beta-1,3-galactosyltransferase 5-like [Condylura cristata]